MKAKPLTTWHPSADSTQQLGAPLPAAPREFVRVPKMTERHYLNAANNIVFYLVDEATGGGVMAPRSVEDCDSHCERVPTSVAERAEARARRKQARRDVVDAKRSKR